MVVYDSLLKRSQKTFFHSSKRQGHKYRIGAYISMCVIVHNVVNFAFPGWV